MTSMNKVWDRLQDRARLHAEAGVLVNMTDARQIVGHICDGESVVLSPGAMDRLALALIRLTLEAKGAQKHFRRAI